jgi:endo-1,4-beta-xylanase
MVMMLSPQSVGLSTAAAQTESSASPIQIQSDVPSVYQTLGSYFPVGAAIWPGALSGPHAELLVKHFNSTVAENAMKIAYLQPTEGAFDFRVADALVDFAKAHRMLMRGHTLAWYEQNPPWLFKDAEGNDLQPSPESKALLLRRLKTHIRTVVSRYKDDVHTWDVVNEVIDPAQPDGFRRSPWFEITGTDFIDTAFRTAREAAPHAKLFTNDFGTTDPTKRMFLYNLAKDLKARGVPIDGVGHQMHINIRQPSTEAIAETMRMFSTLGVDNQITELDVSFYDNSKDSCPAISEDALIEQGYRYRDLFQTFRDLKGELSGVTFWGLADDHTWLKEFPIARLDLPLLFDEHLQAKPAYWGVVDPTRLPAQPVSGAEPTPHCSKP